MRAVLISLLVLAACSRGAPPPIPEEPPPLPGPQTREDATAEDTCAAAAHGDRIGTEVAEMDVPPDARVIRPGEGVDGDMRPGRLNIIVDANGIITELECY